MITLLPILIAGFLHELGHIFTARALGVRIKRAGFSCPILHGQWRGPYGPYVVREPGTDLENLAITLAGPVVNLVLVGTIFLSGHFPGMALIRFAFWNLLLGIYNLLPVPLSDGRRVVRLLQRQKGGAA